PDRTLVQHEAHWRDYSVRLEARVRVVHVDGGIPATCRLEPPRPRVLHVEQRAGRRDVDGDPVLSLAQLETQDTALRRAPREQPGRPNPEHDDHGDRGRNLGRNATTLHEQLTNIIRATLRRATGGRRGGNGGRRAMGGARW